MVIIISQYFPALTNTCLVQATLWKSGEIYCDAFSLGFHISVTIANNMVQITIFANLNDCRFHFQTYNFISLEFF